VRVQVLPRHIESGTQCYEEKCPIALAIMDALEGEPVSGVFVGDESIVVLYENGTEKIFEVPWEISEIIEEYDASGIMYPFGFEL
jgi:hypothetical protein